MNKIFYAIAIALSLSQISCDNANDLLDQYIENGPIVYAGRIVDLDINSGYHKVRVNIYPAEDVNKSYSVLRWNMTNGSKDSLKVDYIDSNYDNKLKCYYHIVDMPDIEGNVLIEAWNVDIFGNRSLMFNKGGYVYGPNYTNTLIPSSVKFLNANTVAEFDNRIGAVDNIVSYEQNNGQFSQEVKVVKSLILVNPKKGGILRSKTRYLMNPNDIDTLVTASRLETKIPL